MPRVTVVDSGTGNLFSLGEALRRAGAEADLAGEASGIRRAECLVLPGVASFPRMCRGLEPFREDLLRSASRGVPILGICAGMQVLFESSEEGPGRGLALFRGRVETLRAGIVPHMGWGLIRRVGDPWLASLPRDPLVYFAHSYAVPATVEGTVAVAEHGVPFAAAVRRDHLFGVQFHPEKSGSVGIAILRSFLREAGVIPSA